jgi:restriction endonuclease S subunit
MAMYGQGKTRGQVGLLELDACTTQNSAAIQPRDGMDSEFLWQYLRSCYDRLRGAGAEGHISHLNLGYLGNFRVIKPSSAEQQEIAGILRTVDERISRSEQKQRLLQDLFRTLLHQLMTAQIRVHDLDLSFLEQEAKAS